MDEELEWVEKTVKKAYMSDDDAFMIRFTDDTWLKVVAYRGYYDSVSLDYSYKLDNYEKMQLEFITKEELNDLIQGEKDRAKLAAIDREKRTLEDLKRKYEGQIK